MQARRKSTLYGAPGLRFRTFLRCFVLKFLLVVHVFLRPGSLLLTQPFTRCKLGPARHWSTGPRRSSSSGDTDEINLARGGGAVCRFRHAGRVGAAADGDESR